MLEMRIKLSQHYVGNMFYTHTWLVMKLWIMTRPDDTRSWLCGPERTLNTFEIGEQFFQKRDMSINALIVILPTVCFSF